MTDRGASTLYEDAMLIVNEIVDSIPYLSQNLSMLKKLLKILLKLKKNLSMLRTSALSAKSSESSYTQCTSRRLCSPVPSKEQFEARRRGTLSKVLRRGTLSKIKGQGSLSAAKGRRLEISLIVPSSATGRMSASGATSLSLSCLALRELYTVAESSYTDVVDSTEDVNKSEAVDALTITALLDTITGLGTDANPNTAATIIMGAKAVFPRGGGVLEGVGLCQLWGWAHLVVRRCWSALVASQGYQAVKPRGEEGLHWRKQDQKPEVHATSMASLPREEK